MKTVFGRVVRVGRATMFLVGLAVVLALTVGLASTAFAAKAPTFKLGVQNAVKAVTSMVGTLADPILRLDNNGAGPALDLQVEPGQAPMTVNSDTRVDNLNSDRLDGQDSTSFARAYARTVVVSPVGTPQQNGTAFKNALSGITGASESNPYLLRIEPGVYDLGTNAVQMKQWVDIEGSGEGVTTLTATSNVSSLTGTLKGASNSELRFLTVENVGATADSQVVAIYNDNASPRLTHVTVSSSGSNSFNFGVTNDGSSPVMTNVTVTASGGPGSRNEAVSNQEDSSPVIRDSTLEASGGDNGTALRSVLGGTVRVDNSRLIASDYTIQNYNGTTTLVGASQLEGGPTDTDGTLTCAGVYDENYAFSPDTCPQ